MGQLRINVWSLKKLGRKVIRGKSMLHSPSHAYRALTIQLRVCQHFLQIRLLGAPANDLVIFGLGIHVLQTSMHFLESEGSAESC